MKLLLGLLLIAPLMQASHQAAVGSASASASASTSSDATAPVFSANRNAVASSATTSTSASSHVRAAASATPTASATDVKTSAAQRAVGVTLAQVAQQSADRATTGHIFPRAWQALHPHLIIPQLVAWFNKKKTSRATGKTTEEEARLRMNEVANLATDIKTQFGFGHKTAVLIAAFVKYYYLAKDLEDSSSFTFKIVASIQTDPELTSAEKQEIINMYRTPESHYQLALKKSILMSIPADAIAAVLAFPKELADLIAQYTHMEPGLSIQDLLDNPLDHRQVLIVNARGNTLSLWKRMISSCNGLASNASVVRLWLGENLLSSIPVTLLPHCLVQLSARGMNITFDDQGGTTQRPSLQELWIDLPVAQQELAIIARAFPNLRELWLYKQSDTDARTDEFTMQIISACTRLEYLSVADVSINHPELTRRRAVREAQEPYRGAP